MNKSKTVVITGTTSDIEKACTLINNSTFHRFNKQN